MLIVLFLIAVVLLIAVIVGVATERKIKTFHIREMKCPDCGEYIGRFGDSSFRCIDCYLRIELDYGTPDKPNWNPRALPMILRRSVWANREDQVNKPRCERVIPFMDRWMTVNVLEGGLRSPSCSACGQNAYFNDPEHTAEDFDAAQPPVVSHTCGA